MLLKRIQLAAGLVSDNYLDNLQISWSYLPRDITSPAVSYQHFKSEKLKIRSCGNKQLEPGQEGNYLEISGKYFTNISLQM